MVDARTYSFRAPAELAKRLRIAESAYQVLTRDPATATRVTRELEIELQRRLRREGEHPTVQGHLLREVTDAFVTAVERAADEERLFDELLAFDRADVAGTEERGALLRASPLGYDG